MSYAYTLKHVSGPAVQPVPLAVAKAHLNIPQDDTNDDAYIKRIISAARRDVENILDRKIGPQTWDIYVDAWPIFRHWVLPLVPLISVESITYTDEDGTETTFDAANYNVLPARNMVMLRPSLYWPTETPLLPFAGIIARVVVGMEPESDGASPPTLAYPEHIQQAILYRVGTFYGIREDVTIGTTQIASEVAGTMRSILSTERRLGV